MFEPRRYFEDETSLNRERKIGRNIEILCAPEFEEIFSNLFKSVDNLFAGVDCLDNRARVKHVEEQMRDSSADDEDSMVAPNKTPGKSFKWRTDDDGIEHEPEKEPPSIFDYLDNGGQFKDICSSAFEVDRDVREFPDSDDEDVDEVEIEVKNPFVFIANRLTFLAQTVQPIIFDTSLIETGSDYITIAINEDKTFPKIRSFDELGLITCKLNCCQTIRDEIGEFIKGTEYTDIFCFPEFISKSGPGTDVWAIKFICYKRK